MLDYIMTAFGQVTLCNSALVAAGPAKQTATNPAMAQFLTIIFCLPII